jgi:hypothetical protein
MSERGSRDGSTPPDKRAFRARVPGFTADRSVGLGDVVKRTATFFGIRPCGGCQRRAAELNRRVVVEFGRRR